MHQAARVRRPERPTDKASSGSSVVKHGVEVVELDASVVGGESPVDGTDGGVAGGDPGRDLLFEDLTVRQAAVEALAGQDAQFDLGHVQPAAVLGGVVQLELVGQTLGL